jgi:hypothetical protein
MKKESKEYKGFVDALKRVLSVSHSEISVTMDTEERVPKPRTKISRVSRAKA